MIFVILKEHDFRIFDVSIICVKHRGRLRGQAEKAEDIPIYFEHF